MSEQIKWKTAESSFSTSKNAIAYIDPKACINCGKCRRGCPVEAISEYQRPICRLCPDCGESPELFPSEIKAFSTAHSCSIGCPLGTTPEGYINLIADKRYQEAYELISELNPLPSICARICAHPCEDECKRGLLIDAGKPLNIRGLKRFVLDRVSPKKITFRKRLNENIAIVGAGPAGITAAFDLAKKGYGVKIYEAGPEPGGMVRKCIPDFRLDKQLLLNEIHALEEAGIEIEYNAKVGKNPSINDLRKTYNAVLIAVGASKGVILPIAGMEKNPYRVYDAVTLLERVNRGTPYWVNGEKEEKKYVDINLGRNVIVIGGGSVALDAARTLVRMGVEKVTCACLESEKEMPAPKDEIEEAAAEGISFICGVSPQKINCVENWMKIEGILFAKVKHIEHDENGRLVPVLEEGENFIQPCDSIVFAVGQKPDVKQIIASSDLKNDNGRIAFDPVTKETDMEGVFVAGDLVEARGSVIQAMASGREAALAIDNKLRNRVLQSRVTHELNQGPQREWIYPAMLEDAAPQKMPHNRYHDTFEEAELGFSEKQAIEESHRCMKCGYEKVDPARCIGCGVCSEHCPVQAITMEAVQKGEDR